MYNERDCLYLALRKLNKLIADKAATLFEDLDIHPSYAYILMVVEERKIVKTKDISTTLSLESSTVTRMVNKLIKQGYLSKGSSESTTDIYLTDKGSEIMPIIKQRWEEFHSSYDVSELLIDVNETIKLLEDSQAS